MNRHNLFFTPEQETGDFHSVLQQVQEYIAGQHSELLSDGNANQAKANIVVDRQALDVDYFADKGGFVRINRCFDGRLPDILREFNERIWSDVA